MARRRGLGSSSLQHEGRARELYRLSERKSEQAAKYAQEGKCGLAMKGILHAAELLGMASAHHDSAGAGTRITNAAGAVSENEGYILKRCMREGSLSGRRR